MRLAAVFSSLGGLSFLAATSFGLMACGGGSGDDAGVTITGDPHTYVVDSITVPTDQNSANNLGFDLDGDGTIDNQLGSVLSAIVQAAGSANLDIQGGIDKSVNDGSILLLADLQATAIDQAANAGLFVFLGTNPMPAPCTNPADPTTCGQHLLGTGSFDIDPNGPQNVSVGGNIIGGTFSNTVPGNLALQISFQGAAVNLTLVDAYAQISGITADGFGDSKIGGAVPNSDIQNNVIPAVAAQVQSIIVRDCYMADGTTPNGAPPDCGCIASSTGATLVGLFDTSPADCTVGVDEFRNNNLIKTLLQPDVDTNGDGTTDALSVGVGVTAVKGTWTPPSGHGAP